VSDSFGTSQGKGDRTMDKLELYTSELLMLKEMMESDLESTGWSEIDFSDVELMKYYSDRAVVYQKVLDLLRK